MKIWEWVLGVTLLVANFALAVSLMSDGEIMRGMFNYVAATVVAITMTVRYLSQ